MDSSAQDQQSEARSGAAAVQPSQPAALPVPMARDSLEKLALVMALCEEMGVLVAPTRLGRLKIIPLLAWHHKVRRGWGLALGSTATAEAGPVVGGDAREVASSGSRGSERSLLDWPLVRLVAPPLHGSPLLGSGVVIISAAFLLPPRVTSAVKSHLR